MNLKEEWKSLLLIVGACALLFWLPLESARVRGAILASLALAKWYAREHVILCLVPAFFIAGAISVFVSQAAVMKYLGARAHKALAYGVAAVSGTILAVCSCTVLPLFAGIHRRGAGLGPATAFLYSGPAINVLAIILTARILGLDLGVARALGAVVFSVVIGLLMALVFRAEERQKADAAAATPPPEETRPLWQNALYFASMVGILVCANWGAPAESEGVWHAIWSAKWIAIGAFALALGLILVRWFGVKWWAMALAALPAAALALVPVLTRMDHPLYPLVPFAAGIVGLSVVTGVSNDQTGEWLGSTWGFAKQILPLLVGGVLVAGLCLGSPDGGRGLIPRDWVASSVGGNSLGANLFAAVAGAFMYFATLTEVPILQGLLNAGMGKGPALALLLAGPALSLPNMLVIRSVMGTKKTVVFVLLVVAMATASGLIFGLVEARMGGAH
jgi:uncharacterized membrane protein YraQ (UPF0718 family)